MPEPEPPPEATWHGARWEYKRLSVPVGEFIRYMNDMGTLGWEAWDIRPDPCESDRRYIVEWKRRCIPKEDVR